MRKSLILLATLAAVFSCKNETKESFPEMFQTTKNISVVKAFEHLTDSLQAPGQILAINNNLVFTEPKCSELLYLIQTNDQISRRLLHKGKGADETIDVQQIGKGNKPNTFYAHDAMLNKYYLYTLEADSVSAQSYPLKEIGYSISAMAFDDTLSFFETVHSEKRFVLKTPSGQYPFGENMHVDNFSSEQLYQLLQGPCIVSPKQKRLAWFSMYGDAMEIYDYTDANHIQTICSQIVNFLPTAPDGTMLVDAQLGISSITTDDTYIYALYNGKKLAEIMKDVNSAFFSNTVMVFDWDGKPVEMWNLDHSVSSITYSEQDHCLYGIGIDEELSYTVYKVENIF